ncbi:hypothetical protein SAMN04489761_3765 [Tenacibaculum sp. MAR_2009_124]|uniref:hypothetical protein n=1 Tax=Tenacibaculum sp. MAR_2009_124 TaxID=1250059 RepID=UPI00089B5881|nr:hypothetical protein [Tenacibaculum sp. MAR_2009_124]SEC84977.1 hypothetical protein SAMN04489761_3765 [Tenacibaculum sp. MAR_2009_124]
MITDLTLKKLSFENIGYDSFLNAMHYNFTHPTKGKFIAVMANRYSEIHIDSVDYSINLIFKNIQDLKEWILENV